MPVQNKRRGVCTLICSKNHFFPNQTNKNLPLSITHKLSKKQRCQFNNFIAKVHWE